MYKTNTIFCLKVIGRELAFEAISQLLEVQPYETHRFFDLDSSGAPYGMDGWLLLVPVDPDEEPNNHLLWLGKFISRHVDAIRLLNRNNDVMIHCRFRTESDVGGFELSAEALRAPVLLGLRFEFDTSLM